MTLEDLIARTKDMRTGTGSGASRETRPDEYRLVIDVDGQRFEVDPEHVSIGFGDSGPRVCIQAPGPSIRRAVREIEAARADLDRALATLRSETE